LSYYTADSPFFHLLFHEGHEQVEQSQEGWIHVDMIHASWDESGSLPRTTYLSA